MDSYVTARQFYEEDEFKYVKNVNITKLKKAEKRNPNSTVVMYKDVNQIDFNK